MMYEYRFICVYRFDAVQATLNTSGSEGWRLAVGHFFEETGWHFILERPFSPPSAGSAFIEGVVKPTAAP